MKCDIRNHSSMSGIEKVAESLYKYAQKQLGFEQPARVVFESHGDRAVDLFSPTANYNPQTRTIKIFVDHRHPKDILRSMAHELIHHAQCCQGAFDDPVDTSPGYAQKDGTMRDLERDAYFWGNGILFRDWEDNHKSKRSWNLMNENKKMSLNEQKLRQKVRRMIEEMLQEQTIPPVTATTKPSPTVKAPPTPPPKAPEITPPTSPNPPPTTAKAPTQPPTGTTTPMEEGNYKYKRDDKGLEEACPEGEELEEQEKLPDGPSAEEMAAQTAVRRKEKGLTGSTEASPVHFEEGEELEERRDQPELKRTEPLPHERLGIQVPGGNPAFGTHGGGDDPRLALRRAQEKALQEWYNDTLHEALLKKFKIKK